LDEFFDMKIKDITKILNDWAPLHYAEDFDNTGLLVGDENTEVEGILVALDTLEKVVDEAIAKNCNLIVGFHPIVFSGLKKITGKNYVERSLIKALKNDIAIFALHTALDNSPIGVNNMMCEKLGLSNRKIMIPKAGNIKKLVTYVPKNEAEKVREALFEAGAGSIGNYDNCSFNTDGTGTFKGNEDSNPTVGERGKIHSEPETQLNLTFPKHLESQVLKTLFKNHRYEEVAFEISTLDNFNQNLGMGMLGELPEALPEKDFLRLLQKTFGTGFIRHSNLLKKEIKKVAVLGGSGAFAIPNAIRGNADAFVTADLKYHDFFKAEEKILLADIGHYESEQFTKNLIHGFLTKKICNFAPAPLKSGIVLSETNTNPVQYFHHG
jgi:dinuclear metal center YbgI/SA1388 family protein